MDVYNYGIKQSLSLFHGGGEGGSSIVKVPGDVPPISSLAKGILFGNFSRV